MKRKESPRTTRSVSSSSEEEEENDHANEKDATRTTTTTTGLSTRRRRNKNNNTKTSERSANESKATTTGKFLSRLLAEEKENESEDALVKKLEKATRRARFDEKNDEDVKGIGRTFEDDDDDCNNPLVKGGDIRFIEASGKRTPTVRRVECKKKKEKTKRREHTTTEEEERRMLEEELSGTEKCLFAKHYSANVCVKAPSRCWFETTVESFRDEIGGEHDYVGWARKDVELSETCGIAEFCTSNKGKCSSVRVWNDDWVFRGEDRAFERKEKSDAAKERGVFDSSKGSKGEEKEKKKGKKTGKRSSTEKKLTKEFEDRNYVPLYASDTNRNVFAVGSIVLSTIAFEMKYVEFRYYVDGVLYKIDRIKRDAREKDDDENAWWFPVTSHSSELNDVTFNFGTYPMFRNVSEEARKSNEEFLARAKKIYGDNDATTNSEQEERDLFSCLHSPFTRSSLHVDVSSNSGSGNSSGSNENSKNEAFLEDELRRSFLRPIKKLMSAISTGDCPVTNKKDIHILFWQLLRTYFDSSFRMDNFFSLSLSDDGREDKMDVDDTLKLKSVFTSPWKVDATKAKRECFALCRLLVAHDPHVLEYNYGKEEDEKRNALLLSNDEFDVFCEMLKDDGNIVMGSSIRGSRMLDWWFPRCLFECLSFMASRELFCGIEEDLALPHPLERASKLLRATEEEGNFRILSHQSWGANFTRLFATRELSVALMNAALSVDETTLAEEKPPAVYPYDSDDDDKEEEEERHAEFSENQKTRLNRLKIYTERREQCKAAFVFAAMTTSLRNVPERAIDRSDVNKDELRDFSRHPRYPDLLGAFEAIKCPIDWEATENITSNDGSTFDGYEYDREIEKRMNRLRRNDRVIDDRAEKKFERNDHFTSDTIQSNHWMSWKWMYDSINTGFFRDRTIKELLDYNCTTDMIFESHGLNSNKFGTTPLDFWMQETTRWAYDRYEPFAKDPHAALKGTRVGLAARHLIDTLSRLLEDEVEAWIEDQFTVSKALFYHYYVANPWHTPRAGDRYWRDDDELNKRPKNGSEYWCCPITPLQHYVPGCLKRNRWVRNYDYQRTKRERRAHANIQYDLTSGFDAELLCAAQFVPKGNSAHFWDWNIFRHESRAEEWSKTLLFDYTKQTREADAIATEMTEHAFMTGGTPPVVDGALNEKSGKLSRKAAEEFVKKRQDSLPKETLFTRLRWSRFPCDGVMLDPPTEINAHVRDRYSHVHDKTNPRNENELSFRDFFKYKAGDSLRQPYKNASEHIAQLFTGMSHLSTFLVEPGETRPRRQTFLREVEAHDTTRTQSNVLRSAYEAIVSNNAHTERARVRIAGYCAKLIVSRSRKVAIPATRPHQEEEWKKPFVPMALVCFIFNTWRDHFEDEKYVFDHDSKFAYVLQLYCHSMAFENPGARDVCRKHIELAFKFPLVKKFAFQTRTFADNFLQSFSNWCKSVDASDLNSSREEEMEKQISFMMRVLSNVPEGSKNAGPERPGFSPIRETLILSMRRYLEYLAKDLGDLNEGLIECMRVFKDHPELIPGYGVNQLHPKHWKKFQMLFERIIERLECVARLLTRCRGILDSRDFMFEPGLMDQLAEIIAYIGKHFHLKPGREGTENPFGVFVKHLASELDFQQDVNGVLCVDPGRFLNPVVEILCRMTESPLPEEEERHDYYDLYSGCDFLNVRNLFTRVHGEDEVDGPIRDHGDDRQHFKCKVRGEFLDALVRHVTRKDVQNLSFYFNGESLNFGGHSNLFKGVFFYMSPSWFMDKDVLSEGTITEATVHPEDVMKDGAQQKGYYIKMHLNSVRCENRILHAAAVKALHMKLNDLEALDGNKNILPEMLDPITHSIMLDPVFVGKTEKTSCDFSTLSRHFQKSGKRTDPFTGLPVVGEIRRNAKLKERIKKLLQKENAMSMIGDVDVDVFTPDDAMSVEWARVNEDRNTFNADDDVRSIGDWRKNWRLGNYE